MRGNFGARRASHDGMSGYNAGCRAVLVCAGIPTPIPPDRTHPKPSPQTASHAATSCVVSNAPEACQSGLMDWS